MPYLKNPYLSFDSDNLLIRKNYKVIQSSSKQHLFPTYEPTIQKPTNYKSLKNHQPITSSAAITSCPKLKNPFCRQILSERSINIKDPYTNGTSFHPQPYFHQQQQQKQLPYRSYNQPQIINRSMSLAKVNHILSLNGRKEGGAVVINRKERQLFQQKIPTPYRPYFISPSSKQAWNTQRWKREVQLTQRQRLQKFGPEGLRYDGKLLRNSMNNNLNTQYYSTSSSIEINNDYQINVYNQQNNNIKQSSSNNQQQQRNSLYEQMKNGYAIYDCNKKQHKQEQQIGDKNILENNNKDDNYEQMVGYSFDQNNGGFESKCGDNENKHGPLDLRAFDNSDYYLTKKEESFQYIVKQMIKRQPPQPQVQFTKKTHKPYPQQLSYNGKSFYRIKLVEDKN